MCSAFSGLYYHSQNVWQPEVGDWRVQFSYSGRHGDEYTVVGRQTGREIRPYETEVSKWKDEGGWRGNRGELGGGRCRGGDGRAGRGGREKRGKGEIFLCVKWRSEGAINYSPVFSLRSRQLMVLEVENWTFLCYFTRNIFSENWDYPRILCCHMIRQMCCHAVCHVFLSLILFVWTKFDRFSVPCPNCL